MSFGDFLLRIKGHQDGTEYNIATLKMAVSSLSELKFLPYSNPFHSQQFSGVGAMSLHVLDDVESLDFAVEVYEDQNNNPFGINTKKLANAVEDMVDSLFIPLVNDALREFPLTGLRTCGIELDAARVQVLSIPSQGTPYLRFQAPLKSYDFSGTCNLKPDFDTPLPPLPPNPDPGPGTGGPNEPGPGDRILDMDFNQLPFTLGKTEPVPKIDEDCRSNIFFEVSCASASVQYKKNNQGDHILDDRGRKIYDFTAVTLTALVSKDRYDLRTGARDSVEGRFFDFESWDEYVADFEEHIVIHDSKKMSDIETEVGTFQRHYSDYETNSPKASGFIPIRAVTMHRILESPAEGAEVSTEFFANISNFVEVPPGRKNLSKAEGLDYQVGNIHLLDCGKVSWCGDAGQWLVIYDSKIRPADKSIPEDVLPYLKQALNSIMAGMFK